MFRRYAHGNPGAFPARAAVVSTLALILTSAAAGPAPAQVVAAGHSTHSYTYISDATSNTGSREFEYALIESGSSSTTSFSNDDHQWRVIDRLRAESESTGRSLIWFSLEGRGYVVRDRELVAKAHEIVEPMRVLGAEQGRVGRMQGEMGRRQGAIGRIQGRIGALQGRLAVPGNGLSSEERADLRRELAEISAQARDLASEQGELGARQGELGARMGELGRKQALAAKRAQAELRELARDAIANGRAERKAER